MKHLPILTCASSFGLALLACSPSMAFTRPSTPPATNSLTVMVSETQYDDLGRVRSVIDNVDTETRYLYDALGRRTYVIENYTSSSITIPSGVNVPSGVTTTSRDADENRITYYEYNEAGQVTQVTALDPASDGTASSSDDQVTRYVYSGELSASYSPVANNNLLIATIYPDSDDTVASNALSNGTDNVRDRVGQNYTAGGTIAGRTDARGTAVSFDYDEIGRRTEQVVTTLGGDTDGSVRAVDYTYTDSGQIDTITSYSDTAMTSEVNAVSYTYNGFQQPLTELQDHDPAGAGTDYQGTLTYGYDTSLTGSAYNDAHRLHSVTYPNGDTSIEYGYGSSGGIDDALSRPNEITNGSVPVATYDYYGSGRLATKELGNYDVTSNLLTLDYEPGTSGYDRFGRPERVYWSVNTTDVFDIEHGYDAAGNRLYADRQLYPSDSQSYAYDELHRLNGYAAGPLDTSTDQVQARFTRASQNWDLDALGNPIGIDTPQGNDYISTSVNQANEFTEYDVTGRWGAVDLVFDTFDANSASDYEMIDGDDSISVDTVDGVATLGLGGNGLAIALFGDAGAVVGQTYIDARLEFAAESGVAGVVYNYVDDQNYTLAVLDAALDERRIYEVNGGSVSLIHTLAVTVTANTPVTLRINQRGTGHPFGSLGLRPGRVGLYSETGGVEFKRWRVTDAAQQADITSAWDSQSDMGIATGPTRLYLKADRNEWASHAILLKGVQGGASDGLEMTFSATLNGGFGVCFDAFDRNTMTFMWLPHYSGTYTPSVTANRFENGGANTSYANSLGNNNQVNSSNGTLWYRLTVRPNLVEVRMAASEAGLNSASPFYRSTSIPIAGGQLGFLVQDNRTDIDNVTVKRDHDNDGSFTDAGTVIEHVEDFDISANGGGGTGMEGRDAGPTYDAAGNLTYDGVFAYGYDAWNRLTTIHKAYRDPSTNNVTQGSLLATYVYDGLNRRVSRHVTNSGRHDGNAHDFYRDWQLVETRGGSDYARQLFVWGLMYIDELVAISNFTATTPTTSELTGAFDSANSANVEVLYAAHDAMFNVLGVFKGDGSTGGVGDLAERYEYTPYGQRKTYVSGGSNDDLLYQPVSHSPSFSVSSLPRNPVGFQGLIHDQSAQSAANGGLIYQRNRMNHPGMGRFMQRDPLEYIDGQSLYAGYFALSLTADPYGLFELGLPLPFPRELPIPTLPLPSLPHPAIPSLPSIPWPGGDGTGGSVPGSGGSNTSSGESNTNNCRRVIQKKIQLVFVNVPGRPNWTQGRQDNFRRRLERVTEWYFGNSGMIATPRNDTYDVLVREQIAPGIDPGDYVMTRECRDCPCKEGWEFYLDLYFGSGNPDWTIEVRSNPNGVVDGSSAQLGGPNGYFDEHDVYMQPKLGGSNQVPAVHEIGHLLGLGHPGHELMNPPLGPEYGLDQYGLMGGGMLFRPYYFDQWVDDLNQMYPGCRYYAHYHE